MSLLVIFEYYYRNLILIGECHSCIKPQIYECHSSVLQLIQRSPWTLSQPEGEDGLATFRVKGGREESKSATIVGGSLSVVWGTEITLMLVYYTFIF